MTNFARNKFIMQICRQQIILLSQRLLLLLALFFAGRFYFWIHNLSYFAPAWPEEVFNSFFYGIQFDVSALVYFNLPLIVLHLLPGRFFAGKTNERILKYYFIIVNGLLLLSNLIDAEYFRFTGKRTTSDIFSWMGMSNDIFNLIPRYLYDYWYIMVIWALMLYATWRFYPSQKTEKYQTVTFTAKAITLQTLIMILATGFLISLARGYRLKPIRVITATNYVSPGNIPLILNTPFTIMKSFNKQQLTPREYFTPEKAQMIFDPVHISDSISGYGKPNVILIIMESFSREYSGYLNGTVGYMPFLDSLMQESLYFPNAFANGMKSLEALPAIVASIPALIETPFVSSPYSAYSINALPQMLKNSGYHTSFFHGGINGTMGFDDFAGLAGIESYHGKNEFGNDDYFDGNWGIYDEQFFQYFAGKLNSKPQPFFSCFFSLSSHHPYTIPEEHRGRFPEGDHPVHETIAYADYSLRKFFETIKEEEWFKNTLFIITADHTYQSKHPYYRNRLGNYAVPMVYYHPGNSKLKGRNLQLTQHIDIMPSVIDYAGAGGKFVSFGRSVFSGSKHPFVINYLNHLYQYMEGDWVLFHDGDNPTGLYNFKTDSLLNRNIIEHSVPEGENVPLERLENRFKSIVQQFNSRMINNNLTDN